MSGQAIVRVNENEWAVSLATTYAELVWGLSGVPSIPAGTGMLFILPSDQAVSVTTQALLFNIDIVFINAGLEVVDVARNVAPGPIVTESTPVRYFLEVNAGEADDIESGDMVGITIYQVATNTLNNWISPLISFVGLMAIGTFMVTTVRSITKATLGEPTERLKLLPQALPEITQEEWQYAEGMWEVTKEDAEKGEVAGVYLWALMSKYYPDDKDKQIRLMGFMNQMLEKYPDGRVPQEEARALAKKWDVEKVLVKEMMEFLPQLVKGRTLSNLTERKPRGTCYEDAWRFLLREEEGELIHGSVESQGKRIKHAWVELPTGYIWEPENKLFIGIAEFKRICKPQEDSRYSVTEAAIMASRTKNFGPWSEEEKKQFLKEKSPAIKPSEYLPQISTETRLDGLQIVKAYKQISRHGEDKITVRLEAWAIFPRGRRPHFISMYRSGDEYVIHPLYAHVAEWVRVPVVKVKAWVKSLPVQHFEPMAVGPELRAEAEKLAREVDEPIAIIPLPSKEVARVIPVEKRPRREGDLEYLADSPEYLTKTIDATGYRSKLDTAFHEAIARAKGLK